MTASPPRTSSAPPRRSAGYSLVELLVVTALLAIVASVAMVSLGGDGGATVDLAGLQVQDTVLRAQALAASQRLAHGVVFDPDQDTFAVVDATGSVAIDPLTKSPFIVDFSQAKPSVDVVSASFGDAGTAILFDAQGVPVAGGTLVLRRENATRSYTLDAATGLLE